MPTDSRVEILLPKGLDPLVPAAVSPAAGPSDPQLHSDLVRATTDDSDPGQAFRRVFGWVALFAALFWGTFIGGFLAYHTLQPDGWMIAAVEGSGVVCKSIKVPLFVPAPEGERK